MVLHDKCFGNDNGILFKQTNLLINIQMSHPLFHCISVFWNLWSAQQSFTLNRKAASVLKMAVPGQTTMFKVMQFPGIQDPRRLDSISGKQMQCQEQKSTILLTTNEPNFFLKRFAYCLSTKTLISDELVALMKAYFSFVANFHCSSYSLKL